MTSLPFEILEMENLYSKKNPFALCQFKGMCPQFYYFLYTLKSILQTTNEETVVGVK